MVCAGKYPRGSEVGRKVELNLKFQEMKTLLLLQRLRRQAKPCPYPPHEADSVELLRVGATFDSEDPPGLGENHRFGGNFSYGE